VIKLSTDNRAVLLPVKIVPGVSRTRYLGEWQGRARIAVAAPPEKGKANQALIAFLSKWLGVRRNDIAVTSGRSAPQKTVRIEGIPLDAVRALLEPDRS